VFSSEVAATAVPAVNNITAAIVRKKQINFLKQHLLWFGIFIFLTA
jgi:hypothetical protein